MTSWQDVATPAIPLLHTSHILNGRKQPAANRQPEKHRKKTTKDIIIEKVALRSYAWRTSAALSTQTQSCCRDRNLILSTSRQNSLLVGKEHSKVGRFDGQFTREARFY